MEWLDRNYRRLVAVSLAWLVVIGAIHLALIALKYKSFDEVAREEVRKWLATHNITVVVKQPSTVTLPSDVFVLLIVIMGFAMITSLITALAR